MRASFLEIITGFGKAILFYILFFFLFLFGIVHQVQNLDHYLPVIIWMIFFLSNFFLIDSLFKKEIENQTFAHLLLNLKGFKRYILKQIIFTLFMTLLYVLFAITIAHIFVKFDQEIWLKYVMVLGVSGMIFLFSGLLIHTIVMCSKHPMILYFICYIPIMIPVFLFSLGILYDPNPHFLKSEFYYLLSLLCFVILIGPISIQTILIQLTRGKL